MKPTPRTKSILALLAVGAFSAISANAATTFNENFDASSSAPAGWVLSGATISTDPDYSLSGNNSLRIDNLSAPSATTPALNLTGATTATLTFQWTTDVHGSAFGRTPFIQYSSNGTTFTEIGTISVPPNTASIPAHTLFEVTITDASHSFTSNSTFRILGDSSGGSTEAPIYVDDFSVTSDAIPEPSAALLGGVGMLMLLRHRR